MLLKEELLFYKELDKLVEIEKECVIKGDIDELLAVLSQKQSIISAQQEVQNKWKLLGESLGVPQGRESPTFWKVVEEHLDDQEYAELKKTVAEIRTLLESIIEKEAEVRDMLNEKIQEIRRHLLSLTHGKKIINGYLGSKSYDRLGTRWDNKK